MSVLPHRCCATPSPSCYVRDIRHLAVTMTDNAELLVFERRYAAACDQLLRRAPPRSDCTCVWDYVLVRQHRRLRHLVTPAKRCPICRTVFRLPGGTGSLSGEGIIANHGAACLAETTSLRPDKQCTAMREGCSLRLSETLSSSDCLFEAHPPILLRFEPT